MIRGSRRKTSPIAAFSRKKNLRLLLTGGLPDPARGGQSVAVIAGGLLIQDRDNGVLTNDMLKLVTKRAPTSQERNDCLFAWTVAKHVKSNAIVFANSVQTVAVGAGQMSRVDAARFAALNAKLPLKGTSAASDAFFPFRDGLDEVAKAHELYRQHGLDEDRPLVVLGPGPGEVVGDPREAQPGRQEEDGQECQPIGVPRARLIHRAAV